MCDSSSSITCVMVTHVMCQVPCVMCHVRHVSCVMCHVSCVTRVLTSMCGPAARASMSFSSACATRTRCTQSQQSAPRGRCTAWECTVCGPVARLVRRAGVLRQRLLHVLGDRLRGPGNLRICMPNLPSMPIVLRTCRPSNAAPSAVCPPRSRSETEAPAPSSSDTTLTCACRIRQPQRP